MYTTLEAFERRLGRAYCEIYATDAPRALADLATAQAEIDGKLARRYAVPLTGQVAASLAAEWQLVLASELAFGNTASGDLPAKLQKRIDEVRKQLEAAASGDMLLPGAAESAETGATFIASDPPVFGRKNMKGY